MPFSEHGAGAPCLSVGPGLLRRPHLAPQAATAGPGHQSEPQPRVTAQAAIALDISSCRKMNEMERVQILWNFE